MRRWPTLVANLALAAASLVVAALGVEALARVFFPQWAPRTGALTEFWRYDPDYGWSHVPDTRGRFAAHGFDTTVTINADGFRGGRVPLQREPARRRVLVLGDSYVWGFGVEDQEVFTARLAQACPGLDVVNLGVSGYSTDQEVMLYRGKGAAYSPDVVVLVVATNDYEANAAERQYVYYYKPRFALDGERLVLRNHPVPRVSPPLRALASMAKRSYVLTQADRLIEGVTSAIADAARPAPAAPRGGAEFPKTMGQRVTVALVKQLAETLRASGTELVVVFTEDHGRRGRAMERALAGNGITFVHLVESFDARTLEEDHLPGDFHWSADGHRRVAGVLASALAHLRLVAADTCPGASELVGPLPAGHAGDIAP
jgi:lysophospholipase L1-like esterase